MIGFAVISADTDKRKKTLLVYSEGNDGFLLGHETREYGCI